MFITKTKSCSLTKVCCIKNSVVYDSTIESGGLFGKYIDNSINRIEKYFIYKLKKDTKILIIDTKDKLNEFLNNKDSFNEYDVIDFSNELDDIRKGSILVLNLDKIIPEKNKLFILILFFIIFIGIISGVVYINKSSIKGTTPIDKVTWDIHYENLKVKNGSVKAIKKAKIIDGGSTITYEVPLNIPGEFYEFTVDVVNGGTEVAVVSHKPTLGGVTKDDDEYLNYTVSYSDGTDIKVGDILDVGDKVTYKVRIEFDKDIEVNQLPKKEKDLNLSFAVNYVQK